MKLWPVSLGLTEKAIVLATRAGSDLRQRAIGDVWVRWKLEQEVRSWLVCTRLSKTSVVIFAVPVRTVKPRSATDGYAFSFSFVCVFYGWRFAIFWTTGKESRSTVQLVFPFHSWLHRLGRRVGGQRDHRRWRMHQGLLSQYGRGRLLFRRRRLSDWLQPYPPPAADFTAALNHPTHLSMYQGLFVIM